MSKMSRIAMELDEQAVEWGFRDREDAEAHGLAVAYGKEGAYLYKPQPEDEQLKAHKAWLKEREEVLEEQRELHDRLMELGYDALAESAWHAIKFIEEGEY